MREASIDLLAGPRVFLSIRSFSITQGGGGIRCSYNGTLHGATPFPQSQASLSTCSFLGTVALVSLSHRPTHVSTMVAFGDLSTAAGLGKLNNHLKTRSYVEGCVWCSSFLRVYRELRG